MNIIDLPRSLRMLAGPYHYRMHLLRSHQVLWTKMLRLSSRKLRDFRLLRRKDLSPEQRQKELLRLYLEDPAYQKWLDSLTTKVWF